MLPNQGDIHLPLLKALISIGGQGKAKVLYPLVTAQFPHLSEADLADMLPSGRSSKWVNRIQWARQELIERGEMTSAGWGVWAITDKGRSRVKQPNSTVVDTPSTDLLDIYDRYETTFKRSMLSRLHDMTPRQFEHFAMQFLVAYGFNSVSVTKKSKDGGIDGFGRLKVGLALMDVTFQCKRWRGNVGLPEINEFRGACQGVAEQGIFFATSDFTQEAQNASIKKGAVPIVLINGEAMIELMIEKGFGVARRPLYVFNDDMDELLSSLPNDDQ